MVEMPGHLTIEIGSDAHKGVMLRRGSQEMLIPPPQNVIWTRMLVAKSANEAFLLAHEEIGHDMCHWPSLYRVALPGPIDSLSNYNVAQVLSYAALTNLVGDALIGEVDGASDDGKRLLLTLAFREPANAPWATYVRRQSHYFYPENETNLLRLCPNFCSSECAGRVPVSIQSTWRRIAERFR